MLPSCGLAATAQLLCTCGEIQASLLRRKKSEQEVYLEVGQDFRRIGIDAKTIQIAPNRRFGTLRKKNVVSLFLFKLVFFLSSLRFKMRQQRVW